MKATLRKMGNSQGVIIPKAVITQLGFENEVEMRVTESGLVLEKPQRHPREGWAEASQALANEEPDHEFLDFPNDFDEEEWTWPTEGN